MSKHDIQSQLLTNEFKHLIKQELKDHNITDKEGILTGAFLTQLVRKFLNKPLAFKVNDIDIFILKKTRENATNQTIVGENKSVIAATYASFFEIEKDNQYFILKSERNGLINRTFVKMTKSAYLNNSFAQQLINSFDINAVQIGYDLKNEKVYFSNYFIEYIKTDQLEIIDYKSPISSLIRIVSKHFNNEGFYDLNECVLASKLFIEKRGDHSGISLSDNFKDKLKDERVVNTLKNYLHITATKINWTFYDKNNYRIHEALITRTHVYWIAKIIMNKVKANVVEKFFEKNEESIPNEAFNFYLLKSFVHDGKASLNSESLIKKIIGYETDLFSFNHHLFMELLVKYTTNLKSIHRIYKVLSEVRDLNKLYGLLESRKIKIKELYDLETLEKKIDSFVVAVDIPLNHSDIIGEDFCIQHLNTLAKCQAESALMTNCISGLGHSLINFKNQYQYLYHLKYKKIDYSLKIEILPFQSKIKILEIKMKRNTDVTPEMKMFIKHFLIDQLKYRMMIRHVINSITNPKIFLKI